MAALIDAGVFRAFKRETFHKEKVVEAIKKSVALTEEDIRIIKRLTDDGITVRPR